MYFQKGTQIGQFHFLLPLRLLSYVIALKPRMSDKFHLVLKLKPMFVCLFFFLSIAPASRRGSMQAHP